MTRIMPRIGVERKTQRRRQFLDAAWRGATRTGFRDMTVDDVCAEAQLSKGAFYGYFGQKRDLLLALFDDDAKRLDWLMDELEKGFTTSPDRLRAYAQAVLTGGEEPGRVQVRADMWTAMLTEPDIRAVFAESMQARRIRLRAWIQEAVDAGELVDIPANAFASILLALSDGLLLHGSLDPAAFKWVNIRKALDVVLEGVKREG
jgi:AcrR family transcriptional regulator